MLFETQEGITMFLKEGEKVRGKENKVVYNVKKILTNGFVILSEENGPKTALVGMRELDLSFVRIPTRIIRREGCESM
jgi:hypothetical protein